MFVKAAIDEGIDKIRITGGEPTLRADLDHFIRMITTYAPHIDLAMTSNGYLLGECAQRLADAGLSRINISLDSLDEHTAHKIAGKSVLANVLAGIKSSIDAGMSVKLNSVILKGINDHEICDLLSYAKWKKVPIRFIEYMENSHAINALEGLKSAEILDVLSTQYDFVRVPKEECSPATLYECRDGYRFGIIEPHKDDFCTSCNRIRLTAEGQLIPCLYFDEALSIADSLKHNNLPHAVEILRQVVRNKPEKNRWSAVPNLDEALSNRAFYMTGG